MTANVEWTPKARQALQEIAKYIARKDHRPRVADELVDDIHAKCQQYARSPSIGSQHEVLPDGFRFFVHKRYVIVFERCVDGIRIHLVVDSARDWPHLFASG
jgi:plasmid stabilization system protein ParE